MTREIDFRAWDTQHKKFDENPLISGGTAAYIDEFESFGYYPEGRMILQQYADQKDDNGVRIYEGDIVHLTSDDGIDYNALIIFKDGGFCAIDGTEDDYAVIRYFFRFLNVEVIGNRFEDIELLKEGEAE